MNKKYKIICFCLLYCAYFSIAAPVVLVLYGTSSAGKTSVARAIMQQSSIPFILYSIDFLVNNCLDKKFATLHTNNSTQQQKDWFYYKQYEESCSVKTVMNNGDMATKLENDFLASLRLLAERGQHLILDEVIYNTSILERYKKALSSIPDVFFIQVFCSLAESERREKERGDRILGFARGLYGAYDNALSYDFKVDATNTLPDQNAEKILGFMKAHS